MSVTVAALLRRKPIYAETSCDGCCAQGHDKGHSMLAYMIDLIQNISKFLVVNYSYLFIVAYW